MSCRHYQQQISDSLNANPPYPADLNEHLAACAKCRDLKQTLTAMDRDLRSGASKLRADDKLSAGFHDQLMKKLQATEILPAPAPFGRRHWLAVAAVFLLLLTGAALVIMKLHPKRNHTPHIVHQHNPEPGQPGAGALLPDVDQHFASIDQAVNSHTREVYARETQNLKNDLQSVTNFLLDESL